MIRMSGRGRPPQRPDRGEGPVSYLAVILLLAVIAGSVVVTGVSDRVVKGVESAICEVTSGKKCQEDGNGTAPGPGPVAGRPSPGPTTAPPGTGSTPPPKLKDTATGVTQGKPDNGNCYEWLDWLCAGVDGLRLGTVDAGKDIWDGVTFAGCLLHICSHDGFKSNWGSIGALFTTNPVTTASTIWDEATKPVRDDWNNGHKVRSVFRAIPSALGTIFGGKGLTKLKYLGGRKKPDGEGGDKPEPRPSPTGATPAQIKAILGRIGEPSGVFVPGRGHELPYTSPPTVRVIKPGSPLDLGTLDPSKTYLWLVDPQGNFRVAPETSPEYGSLFPKRNGNALKHGDLAAGADGAPTGGPLRPPARMGGELKAELGPDGRPTGRWLLDDNSSYAFPNTRLDGRSLGEPELRAVHDLLGTTGTDTSKIVVSPRR